MIVARHMSRDPLVIGPDDFLSAAQEKMKSGEFRHLPVVQDGRLVGIVSDRDLRQHIGFLEKTKVNAAMTETLVTVSPNDTIEKTAQLMLANKIGALPVVEEGKVVGIITSSDILQTFLLVTGVKEEGTSRIDVLLKGEDQDLTTAAEAVSAEGAEVLSVGAYRERWGEGLVCYLRVRDGDPERIAGSLSQRGYTVLGVHA